MNTITELRDEFAKVLRERNGFKIEVERLKAENEQLNANQQLWGSIELITAQRKEKEKLCKALEPFAKFWEVTHDNKTSFNRPGPIFGIDGINFDFEDIKRAHEALKWVS